MPRPLLPATKDADDLPNSLAMLPAVTRSVPDSPSQQKTRQGRQPDPVTKNREMQEAVEGFIGMEFKKIMDVCVAKDDGQAAAG